MSAPLFEPLQLDHPGWCSGGALCEGRRWTDGTVVEWSHADMSVVRGRDCVADSYLVRIDTVELGEHRHCEAVVITADGSFDADSAEKLARAILAHARQLRAGLAPSGGAQ